MAGKRCKQSQGKPQCLPAHTHPLQLRDHRVAEVGRDLQVYEVQPLFKQGYLQQGAQNHGQMDLLTDFFWSTQSPCLLFILKTIPCSV